MLFPSQGERRAFDPSQFNRATTMLGSIDLVRVLDAVVFSAFLFITFFLALGSFSTRNSFRPSDVDVLFPTPVEPKLVLIFRIVRDYLLTLLAPIFFIIVGFRPAAMGVKSLQSAAENPDSVRQTMQVGVLAWLLVAFSWVCINYAASLFINRSDLASSRNRRLLGWGLGIIMISVCGYIVWQASGFQNWKDWAELTENPGLRIFFFTATFATWMVHGVVNADALSLALGVGSLLTVIIVCIKLSMTQAGWMYDQAAVKGFDSADARKLQQSGDTIGLMAAQARQGRVKSGRAKWVSRWTLPGPRAILWKETIITLRSTFVLVILFAIISIFLTLVALVTGGDQNTKIVGSVYLIMQGLGVFMTSSALAQAGFIEMLRRVDVQKPLPFNFSTTILFEVLAKSIPPTLVAWLCSLIALFIRPSVWESVLAGIIALPFLAVVICSVTCLTTLLFPDFEDPSQRGFRGMMNFVGVVVACFPGVLVFGGLATIGITPILAAVVTAGLNLGIAAFVASISGNQYAQFNPSE